MRTKITQSLVERSEPTSAQGRSLYSDTELRGFYLIVTSSKKSFYVQSLVKGRQVRVKLGDHPAMSAKDARDIARSTLVGMRQGKNPNEERRKEKARGITLRDALELHLSSSKLATRTVEDYRYHLDQYLSAWLDKPLAEIGADRKGVRERHIRITEDNGATVADGTFRVFRALYNRGLREHPELPPNPTANVDYHGQKRRKVDAPAEDLKRWGKSVLALHPVRRDLHLFILLTGMRRTAACEARVEHLDLEAGKLHVPKPKGGTSRAFDVPLSPPLLDLLRHRKDESPKLHRKGGWLFPAESKSGHVLEVHQDELKGLTGHALRHVYASLALQSGVPYLELKRLLNHSSSDVTSGYLHLSLPHLKTCQSLASTYILKSVGLTWTAEQWPPVFRQLELVSSKAA